MCSLFVAEHNSANGGIPQGTPINRSATFKTGARVDETNSVSERMSTGKSAIFYFDLQSIMLMNTSCINKLKTEVPMLV